MPHRTAALTTLLLAALVTLLLRADAPSPATKPVEPDLRTPRSAIKSLYQAVNAHDAQAILKTFYAADDAERELAQTFADLIVSGKKLGDAAREQFGATSDALGSGIMSQAELARIDQAELRENGDAATLVPVGQSRPIQFHRTADRWQLAIRDFANAEDNLPRQVALLKKVAGVFNQVAADIDDGKFNSSQEAEAAIQTKLANVMIRAATQASTRPSTKP